MQITFKSEEHRQKFSSLYPCNKWIADMIGMATWEAQIEDVDDRYSSIMVLDGFGDPLEGQFVHGETNQTDHAWIFFKEREYFDIDY